MDKREFILKADGFPVTAQLKGMMAVTIHPENSGAWICIYLESQVLESQEVQDQYAEFLPPPRIQLALDPLTAHRMGVYLIEKAQAAIAPDGDS